MYSCFHKSAEWKVFYHAPARIVECVSEHTLLISKDNKQTNKKTKQQKKLKKKREYPENRLKK